MTAALTSLHVHQRRRRAPHPNRSGQGHPLPPHDALEPPLLPPAPPASVARGCPHIPIETPCTARPNLRCHSQWYRLCATALVSPSMRLRSFKTTLVPFNTVPEAPAENLEASVMMGGVSVAPVDLAMRERPVMSLREGLAGVGQDRTGRAQT
jgi:hypothetical protein